MAKCFKIVFLYIRFIRCNLSLKWISSAPFYWLYTSFTQAPLALSWSCLLWGFAPDASLPTGLFLEHVIPEWSFPGRSCWVVPARERMPVQALSGRQAPCPRKNHSVFHTYISSWRTPAVSGWNSQCALCWQEEQLKVKCTGGCLKLFLQDVMRKSDVMDFELNHEHQLWFDFLEQNFTFLSQWFNFNIQAVCLLQCLTFLFKHSYRKTVCKANYTVAFFKHVHTANWVYELRCLHGTFWHYGNTNAQLRWSAVVCIDILKGRGKWQKNAHSVCVLAPKHIFFGHFNTYFGSCESPLVHVLAPKRAF